MTVFCRFGGGISQQQIRSTWYEVWQNFMKDFMRWIQEHAAAKPGNGWFKFLISHQTHWWRSTIAIAAAAAHFIEASVAIIIIVIASGTHKREDSTFEDKNPKHERVQGDIMFTAIFHCCLHCQHCWCHKYTNNNIGRHYHVRGNTCCGNDCIDPWHASVSNILLSNLCWNTSWSLQRENPFS